MLRWMTPGAKLLALTGECQGKVLNEAVGLTHLFWVSVIVCKTVIALSITEHKRAGAALFCWFKFERYSASLTVKYGIMVLLRVDSSLHIFL